MSIELRRYCGTYGEYTRKQESEDRSQEAKSSCSVLY